MKVPLDREQPDGEQISIAFELYTHTKPGPAESAILVNFGGPGAGTIPTRSGAFLLFANNLATHDLLLIDDRGRGYSGVIDCPGLDNYVGTIDEQVAECAGILGDASDEYGSGDVAKDTNAVRKAIGYDLIDYYGVSYGGADITAFATRFPQYIRSLILDAPWGDTAISQEFYNLNFFVDSTLDLFKRVCRRSPTCGSVQKDPVANFADLVQHVRLNPVDGIGYRPDGKKRHVEIDTKFLIEYFMLPVRGFTSTGEIGAAAAALDDGDPVPLLRLAAENYFPTCCQDPDAVTGSPRTFSFGSFVATYCVDNQWEWDWSSSIPERKAEHKASLLAAPQELFYPFTGPEAARSTFVSAPYCIRWPEPNNVAPMAEPGAVYPDVPTFVLGGDFDNIVPLQQTRLMADKFPGSELVEFKSTTHGAAFSGECGVRLVSRFLDTLEVGAAKCAGKPQSIVPAVGEFPLVADDAEPAKVHKGEGNRADADEPKVAAVAAATVRDVVERASLSFAGTGRVTGRGLRGGRTIAMFLGRSGLRWRIRLKDVR
ncbi:MAG TPA: alpha/beta fold hydrolase, partial [Actinomycetota bacterium]|nr:alpha/beta fold hydrolase [Actinomycetota bacterium]